MLSTVKRRIVAKMIVFLVTVLSPGMSIAQEVELDDLTDGLDDLRETAFTIIEVAMIIVIAAGGITVAIKAINNQEQSKGVLMGWILAIFIYIIVFQVFDN